MLAKSLHIKRFLKDDAVPTIYVAGIVPTVWEQLAGRNRWKVSIFMRRERRALIVMDWAMKFLQSKYREKQFDWFAKRGLSWHISSVIYKGCDRNIQVFSYTHIFDTCTQDWYAVTSIIENLLQTIKKDLQVTKVFLRSDEAGCYHNNYLIAAVRDIRDIVGVEVAGYHFSEPQNGKDVCDRILCPMKLAIRRYCNEGHDILTAQDMRKALVEKRVKGTAASVNTINETNNSLKMKDIPNISTYHNFNYEKNGVRVWKAHGIGPGKLINYENIYVNHQSHTGICTSDNQYFQFQKNDMREVKKNTRLKDEEETDTESSHLMSTIFIWLWETKLTLLKGQKIFIKYLLIKYYYRKYLSCQL